MTQQEYHQQVADNLQKRIWDIELNKDFNLHQIEQLEHDIGKASTVVLYPGINEKEGKKTLAAMQQEKIQRQRKDDLYADKIDDLQEQVDFINQTYLSEELS